MISHLLVMVSARELFLSASRLDSIRINLKLKKFLCPSSILRGAERLPNFNILAMDKALLIDELVLPDQSHS